MLRKAPAVLQTLAGSDGFPRISVYFPTHLTFPACEQDPIRLGNARREIEKQLKQAGWGAGEIETLLAEVRAREQDLDYWKYQDEGLAIFIEPGTTHWMKLPADVPELTIVAERYHLRPLVPILRDEGTFYVLTVTEDDAHLYKSANGSLAELNVEELPDGTGKIRGMTDLDANVGYHGRDRGTKRGGTDAPKYAALGESPEDYQEVILEHYTRDIANAVDAYLANATGPLVIAAVPRTAGRLKDHLQYAQTLDDILSSDPTSLDMSALHEKSRELSQPVLDNDREEIRNRLRAVQGSGDPAYSHNLQDILHATEEGRVDTIFLDPDAVVWGIYDTALQVVRIEPEAGPENEDLLNLAALRTFAQGGDVRSLPADLKSSVGQIAALFRY